MEWKGLLLQRAAARDVQTDGLAALYTEYNKLLKDSRVPVRRGTSQSFGTDDGQRGSPAAAEAEKRFESQLKSLNQVVAEREEELHEKDEAQASLSKEATRLGFENEKLRQELTLAKKQLDIRESENRRLVESLSELGVLPKQGVLDGRKGSVLLQEALVVPQRHAAAQLSYQKVHEAEISCITAAGAQGDKLPQKLVAVSTVDGYVKLLDGDSIKPQVQMQISVSRELHRIVDIALSPGSTGLLLAACADHGCRLLDLKAQKLQHTLRGHQSTLLACGFCKGSVQAFTASVDRTVKLYDIERGDMVRTISSSGTITAAAGHSASGTIFLGHADGTVAVWDIRTQGHSPVCHGPADAKSTSSVSGVCVAPDGQSLASQSEDGRVHVLALQKLSPLFVFEGLGNVVAPSAPDFAPDGSHIVARGARNLRCWSASTGEIVTDIAFEGEAGMSPPTRLCWKLPKLVSAHADGYVALWGSADAKTGS
eukprot:TRINITY_DN33569_c0_g1_i1.p1 TRINITY_DN33569_c0_g1~~TRINITY_DN33569_c0_g1_i1.p1  ORF type:complete len:483 (+),score=102.63 TRINITY_DN33569_c0_g1_i1:148-1596(+)